MVRQLGGGEKNPALLAGQNSIPKAFCTIQEKSILPAFSTF